MSQPYVCVVIPAAGIGERVGSLTPKQFCSILNQPLICYTLDAFERITWIKHVIVCVSSDRVEYMRHLINSFSYKKVTAIEGAGTRHRSIFCGVKLIETAFPDVEVVIIHDAVRPLIDEVVLKNVTKAALEHGAAGVVRPLVSTVVARDEDGFLDHSLDRSKYRASEMPQAFKYSVIKTAYEQCTDYDFDHGTECLHLAQRYGNARVSLIDGPDNLWKVTHRKDLFAFESILRANVHRVTVLLDGISEAECQDLVEGIEHSLQARLLQDVSFVIRQSHQVVFASDSSGDQHGVFLMFHRSACVSTPVLSNLGKRSHHALLIHVFLLQEIFADIAAIMDIVKEFAENSSDDTLVYGLAVKAGDISCWSRAKDIIVSVIFERDPALSGQTFVCR